MSADENETTRLQGEAEGQRGESRADRLRAQTQDAVEIADDETQEQLGDTDDDEDRDDEVRARTDDAGDISGDETRDPVEEASEGVRTGIDAALDRDGE